ncbi:MULTISPECIES: hypothetical protein [Leptospira]|uniref:hypothetical protein n=1 Tax=Leptospira TaxID=171 RepID=UPI000C29E866|nr:MULTISPECIES: hypothetical protein [Leptospira]PJZ43792.1 hypothetical protein CH361_18745 [Leptospira brenneri]PJZ79158.1 hypothetical protein CH359_19500 [Leptospira meyeri]PJZ94976.1 hypothetical protein CH358_19540 [Leptospira meyeri]PKA10484.1 hypothetical protein CH372_19140 [Leptospira meyeri]
MRVFLFFLTIIFLNTKIHSLTASQLILGIELSQKKAQNGKLSNDQSIVATMIDYYIEGFLDGTVMEFETNARRGKRNFYCTPQEGVNVNQLYNFILRNKSKFDDQDTPRSILTIALSELYPCGRY